MQSTLYDNSTVTLLSPSMKSKLYWTRKPILVTWPLSTATSHSCQDRLPSSKRLACLWLRPCPLCRRQKPKSMKSLATRVCSLRASWLQSLIRTLILEKWRELCVLWRALMKFCRRGSRCKQPQVLLDCVSDFTFHICFPLIKTFCLIEDINLQKKICPKQWFAAFIIPVCLNKRSLFASLFEPISITLLWLFGRKKITFRYVDPECNYDVTHTCSNFAQYNLTLHAA